MQIRRLQITLMYWVFSAGMDVSPENRIKKHKAIGLVLLILSMLPQEEERHGAGAGVRADDSAHIADDHLLDAVF